MGIGLVSWACEGLAYFVVLRGVGAPNDARTALAAVFIFSISTVVGAVVATPGGLGGTEGALVTLAMRVLHLGLAPAKMCIRDRLQLDDPQGPLADPTRELVRNSRALRRQIRVA